MFFNYSPIIMSSLIQALGLDVRILLAQFVNFGILVFVLWRFAYKPLFKLLEDRRLKIEQGLKDSETAAKKLEKALKEGKQIIADARQQASAIVEESQGRAEVRYQEVLSKAKEDIRLVMDKEKEKIAQEKEAIVSEVKSELSGLLIASLEKFLGERMDEEKDKKVIERIVKELS